MLFIPVVDNPLHKNYLNVSDHVDTSYDSLTSNDWNTPIKSSTWDSLHQKSSVGLQKSCLKASKHSYYDNLSNRTDNSLQNSSLRRPSLKQLVKWSIPLSTSRIIPARDDLLNDTYIESSDPNPEASQINIIPNVPKSVLEEIGIIPSSTCLDAFPPPSEEFATQDENPAACVFQPSTLEIETFSITKVENYVEDKLFGTIFFPLSGRAFETASQAKISARSQSAGPVAFSTDALDGPTYHENTTKLNLRHLSRSLSPNTSPGIHYSPSSNIPMNPASTPHSCAFLHSTKNPNSLPIPTPSHSSQVFSESSISIPWEVVHYPSPTPGPQITNNHPLDQIPILPPRTVFGSRKSNQQNQTSFPQTKGIKRKAISVEPIERPSKFTKVDQNVKESPVHQEISSSKLLVLEKHGTVPGASSTSSFPGSVEQDDANASDVGNDSGAEGPVTSDDPGNSENDSLFGDSFINHKPGLVHPDTQDFLPENPVCSDKFRSGKYSQVRRNFKTPVRSYTRPITRLVAIRWVNDLKRFQYLRDSGKLDEKTIGELHHLLTDIDKQKSDLFLTPKVLGDTHLGRLVSEFRHGKHGKASKAVADSIVKFWRHRCREVELGYS